MKTVMKKMFCLLMVAVLLVSAMPAVFADGLTCTVETCPKKGEAVTHNPAKDVPATCTTPGKTCYYCAAGHDIFVDIPALGHDFSGGVCQRSGCGFTCPHAAWSAGVVTKAATCDTAGETSYTCNLCKHVHVDATKPAATGHNLVNGECLNEGCDYAIPCGTCGETGHTDADCPTKMCPYCFLNNDACVKCSDGVCVMNEAHYPDCTDKKKVEDHKGQVRVYLNLNYGNAYAYGEQMEYVWVDRNTPLNTVVASIPAPYRDKHNFQYWTTDMNGSNIIDAQNDALATADGVMIYAQWVDIVQSTSGTVDVIFNLNYGGLTETMNNIVFGTAMSDVVEYAGRPVRLNYKFVGWYWDAYCTNPVKYTDRVYMDCQVFAKWEYRGSNNEVMLKVYLNGDTTSLAQIIDMYPYTLDDGCVSLSEAKEAVKKFYTSKDSDGMLFEGLFDTNAWSNYTRNHKSYDGDPYVKVPYIKVNSEVEGDTVVYVMVHNAKIRTTNNSSTSSSSSNYKPDSSNPKTGDMIMTPVIVLTASVGALATLYYLNKKRSI